MKRTILKTGVAGLLALVMSAGVSTSALAAPPDPSAELPADIGGDNAGIQVLASDIGDNLVTAENFDTAHTDPRTTTVSVELTNFYWGSISPIEVETTITPTDGSIPQTLSIGDPEDTRTVEEAGLTETFVGTQGDTITAQLSGLPFAAQGDTITFDYTFDLPAATNLYTNEDGFLAAYGYEYETRIWFEAISPNGERFVFPTTIAYKEMTPVFYNITTGEDESCDPDRVAAGEACVGTSAYGVGLMSAQLPYPPLAQDPPVFQTIPTAGVCEITSISQANGQVMVEAQFDIYAAENGADAPYVFPSIDLSNLDVSPIYVLNATLEDNTGENLWTEAEYFTETVDWRATNQEVRQGSFPAPAFPQDPNITEARFFEGVIIPFTFNTDSSTPVADRELTLAFEVVFPQSEQGGTPPITTCSIGEAITPPVTPEAPEAPAAPEEPMLPRTGGDNTFLLVAAIFGALFIAAGTTFIVRARKVA